jgi:hypothetical protein
MRRGQVEAVLNYVATGDCVIAWFPSAIEKLRLQDLGHGAAPAGQQHRTINVGQYHVPLQQRRQDRKIALLTTA